MSKLKCLLSNSARHSPVRSKLVWVIKPGAALGSTHCLDDCRRMVSLSDSGTSTSSGSDSAIRYFIRRKRNLQTGVTETKESYLQNHVRVNLLAGASARLRLGCCTSLIWPRETSLASSLNMRPMYLPCHGGLVRSSGASRRDRADAHKATGLGKAVKRSFNIVRRKVHCRTGPHLLTYEQPIRVIIIRNKQASSLLLLLLSTYLAQSFHLLFPGTSNTLESVVSFSSPTY